MRGSPFFRSPLEARGNHHVSFSCILLQKYEDPYTDRFSRTAKQDIAASHMGTIMISWNHLFCWLFLCLLIVQTSYGQESRHMTFNRCMLRPPAFLIAWRFLVNTKETKKSTAAVACKQGQ